MPIPLVSVRCLVNSSFRVSFLQDGCLIVTAAGKSLQTVPQRNCLFAIRNANPAMSEESRMAAMYYPQQSVAKAAISDVEFHRCMGHAYPLTLRKMVADGIITGMELDATAEVKFCEICQQAKQLCEPFPKAHASPPTTKYSQRVHTDVWGKAQTRTWDGKEYFVTFLDNYSDEAVVSLIKNKSDALDQYRAYKAWTKMHRGIAVIEELQSDRGGEYLGHKFTAHLEAEGTTHCLTVHNSPQQNRKAERLNRTLSKHA